MVSLTITGEQHQNNVDIYLFHQCFFFACFLLLQYFHSKNRWWYINSK